MDDKRVALRYSLPSEYNTAIGAALDHKVKKCGLFSSDKKKYRALKDKYLYSQEGITLEEAAEIMLVLQEIIQNTAGKVGMGSIGAFAVLRGAFAAFGEASSKAFSENQENA